MSAHKLYLTETVPLLLQHLKATQEPTFGVMTAQHMIEHLIWVAKSSVKDFGPPPEEFTEGQQKFMKFIQAGANFKVHPPKKTREELDPPRFPDLASAIAEVPNAIQRLYNHDDNHVFFNPMMGKASFEEMEVLQAKHFEWHLERQFELKLTPPSPHPV